MKPKRKSAPDRAEPTAAQIARMAGISISLVYRKLQEGRTGAEIIAASQRRKEESVVRGLPATPVNGHAANGTLSLSGAQTEKERWAAALRKLEYQERSGELIPVSYVRHWGVTFLVAAKDEMLKAPGELADTLAAESDPRVVEEVLRRWVERVMDKFYRLDRLWAPTPPEAA
jgi:hypothetical protein